MPSLYSTTLSLLRSKEDGARDLEGDGERVDRQRGALPRRESLRRRRRRRSASAEQSPAAAPAAAPAATAATAARSEPGVGGGVLLARGRRLGRHAGQEGRFS